MDERARRFAVTRRSDPWSWTTVCLPDRGQRGWPTAGLELDATTTAAGCFNHRS